MEQKYDLTFPLTPKLRMTETQINCYAICEIAYLMVLEDSQKEREALKSKLQYFLQAIIDREDKS